MAPQLVGDDDCSTSMIVDTIMSCAGGADELYERWQDIALALGTPAVKKMKLGQDFLLHIINLSTIMESILIEWRARKSKEATISELIRIFREKKFNSVAELLQDTFLKGTCMEEDAKLQYIPPPPKMSSVPGDEKKDEDKYWLQWKEMEKTSVEQRENFGMRMVGEFFDVTVTKPCQPVEFKDDHYKLPSGFKGYALVLNIIEFTNPEWSRAGARHDSHGMMTLWTQLGYKVIMYDDGIFTAARVQRIITEFKAKITQEQKQDPNSISSIVVYLGCHGEFTRIQLSDLSELHLYRDIVYQFDTDNCPALNGKPKIFVVSTCQGFGEGREELLSDQGVASLPTAHMKPIDDTVVCFGSLPGYLAYRHQWIGSLFGYSIAQVFADKAHSTDLLKMLTATEEWMRETTVGLMGTAKKQMPMYSCLGLKTLYFNLSPHLGQDKEMTGK